MDYYQILHLSPKASLKQIKKAYRKLALQHHPDKNNNSKESTELFKQISIAYQVLSDPIQRSYYDNTGNADIDFDLLSSLELFKIFFKDYDPKLVTIIEKTYGRIQEELQDNQTDSLLRVIYNIEKTDLIKDASHLAINYLSEYISSYMKASSEQPDATVQPTDHQYIYEIYDIDTLSPITNIYLPIEYFFEYPNIDITIMYQQNKHALSLQTIFTNHTINIQDKKYTFTLIDKPHTLYTRIQQYSIIMNIDIGLQDYIEGFQFSYNYIHTFIDVPILLSTHSSCIVIFKQYGLPKHATKRGDLIIQFNILKDKDRVYPPPLHTNFIYSTSLKNIL
jgi:DnaJ-class molecular chaperone